MQAVPDHQTADTGQQDKGDPVIDGRDPVLRDPCQAPAGQAHQALAQPEYRPDPHRSQGAGRRVRGTARQGGSERVGGQGEAGQGKCERTEHAIRIGGGAFGGKRGVRRSHNDFTDENLAGGGKTG